MYEQKAQGMQEQDRPEFERHLATFWARWRSGFMPSSNDFNAWWLAFRPYSIDIVLRTFDRLYKCFDTSRMPNCNQALEIAEALARSDYYTAMATENWAKQRKSLPTPEQPAERVSESGRRAAAAMIDLMEAQKRAGLSREEAARARFALIHAIIDRSESLN